MVFTSPMTFADSPLRTHWDKIICTKELKFCVNYSSERAVSVYQRIASENSYEFYYSIAGTLRGGELSEDGEKLISSLDMIPKLGNDVSIQDIPVATMWVHGILKKRWYVRDIIGNHKLKETVSNYLWGGPIGFEGVNKYVFRLLDGTVVKIDLTT